MPAACFAVLADTASPGLPWAAVLAAALICFARIVDVSLGTIRTIYTLRGRKFLGSAIGLVESTIYIVAVSSVLAGGLHEPLKVVGYVTGYSVGIFVGITIEGWIASGWTMIRLVVKEGADELTHLLRADGEAVTRVMGEGRDGPAPILFVVTRRKRAKSVLKLIRKQAPDAFVTVDSVGQAINGTLRGAIPRVVPRFALRK